MAISSAVFAARPTPRLLLTSEDLARIESAAREMPWAAAARDGIVQAARNWPAAHNARYGLAEWALPPDGGQWTLWYVCKIHGVYLQYRGPGQNVCPVDGQNWTGWPFEQVIYARRHSESADAARDNALAFRLTADPAFAKAAARILIAYADVYSTYKLKDVNDRPNTTSAGRVTAQTLDESVWLIPIAWAYDLIADSGVLSAGDRAHIEQDLLRAAVAVISRYDAKISNWQSWHNAAIGAAGFALDDQALIAKAIDGPSGFRFQMRQSVLPDGTWYEGAWGYHFFALDPISLLAEMAARAGIELYADASLRKMFEAPLRFALPDWTLPPFNDSGPVSLPGYDRLYERAYARYGDPLFTVLLGRRARGRDALFWGVDALPQSAGLWLASAIFPDSGYAVLRAEGSDHYIAMKFGPHGGGHGHYDKLGFMSYGRGGAMAVDPGTQSYAAPTHNTWDKVTLAHNTVVVDERTQAEAAGRLLGWAALPGISAVRAEAGPAYRQVALERAMILTADYAVDSFTARATDGAVHRFDWIYHNFGKASTTLPLQAYSELPSGNGYQHLSGTRAALTAGGWQVHFDMNEAANANYGVIYASPSSVKGTFQYSREQSVSGNFSGKMTYDFSIAPGYLLFQTPTLSGQPAEVPLRLSVMIYGDGSGNKLALRLYDSTDERFVYTVGPVDWTGWRMITASDPARWSHYLGNNDGVFDTPTKQVAVEFTFVSGKQAQGALFADDITIEYPSGTVMVADFERVLRSLRVWMVGAADTTVVTGNGLGPDLLKPVPFAMARRRGMEARFLSLLEPYGETPQVTEFRALAPDSFLIRSEEFEDRVDFDAGGNLRLVRRAGAALRRLALSGPTTLGDLLEIDKAVPVQVDYSAGGTAVDLRVDGEATIRLLAPAAERITWNGADVDCARDGEYLICAVGR